MVFLCNVLNILLITFLIIWTKTKNSHICSINHRFPGASRLGKCRDQCWPGFESWQLLLFLHCSHVYCLQGWRKTKTCAAEFDAPLDWGDVIGGHTVVSLKIQGCDVDRSYDKVWFQWNHSLEMKFCCFVFSAMI